ncbi:MAG TPA: sugar ABC transporter ATP-binding protein [Devosia sp.]|jgi:L-arabinose transport system ATP-binding protein|nr:sugar ABC transporter ATP-binding protein [Devosia sp.]
MSSAILEISGVSKAFPNVRALSNLSLSVGRGEVVAIVGENGAGKSTLLKILSGDYRADSGTITLDSQDISHVDPKAAREAGLRVVRQEPEIVPHVTAAENIYLGEFPRRGNVVDFREMRRRAAGLFEEGGFTGFLSTEAMGDRLSPAQKHVIEITRALKPGVKVVAFDEPTSSLTAEETERLFALIRRLKQRGLGIIYVSHRMHEVMAISDRVAVLRDGHLMGVVPTAETTQETIVRMMVGRDLAKGFERAETTRPGETVLEVGGINSIWHRDIGFSIRAGEILGFAGLVGAGRTELAKVIFGEYSRQSGTVRVLGREVPPGSPAKAIRSNIGFAPEDRKGEGLILVRSVIENASLAVFSALSRWGILRSRMMVETVAPLIASLDIKTPSLEQEVGKLSGGNQQKVVLARWLAAKPRVLILDEPTRAVDVGAKAEIYRLIDELARNGMAIMLISSEMPELLALSDRIVVMHGGRLSAPIEKSTATEEGILRLALGQAA